MRIIHILFFINILIVSSSADAKDFLWGADLSFLPRVEAGGASFKSDGVPTDLFEILADGNLNIIRLRLWHSPPDGHSGLGQTLALARRAKAAGFGILLDVHYSDTWADPGHQEKPAARTELTGAALSDSVREYTENTLRAFAAAGVAPDIVQLGNEITAGLLWDEGRVGGSFDTPAGWTAAAGLLLAAIQGVDDALPGDRRPEIMIHIDRGGDNTGARWFFDNLAAQDVAFDLIGLSFYPWWHGTLADLRSNLNDLASRYGKDLVIVETAYPWTLGWFDGTHNPVGLQEHLLPGYPASPEGQLGFLAAVREIVAQVPDGRGRGVFWWAPEWIATPGFGSSWENLTLFDQNGEALPALVR